MKLFQIPNRKLLQQNGTASGICWDSAIALSIAKFTLIPALIAATSAALDSEF